MRWDGLVNTRDIDYLIVGQGLAGSTLARLLLERGRRLVVVDREDPSSASRVAAGLVNPVTGMKLVKTRNAETFLPKARSFYQAWERDLGERFYQDRTIWRFFRSEREEEVWRQKASSQELAGYAGPLPSMAQDLQRSSPSVNGSPRLPEEFRLRPQRGGFAVKQGASVETRELLCRFREQLRERGAVCEEFFNTADLRAEVDGVVWREWKARRIIFCDGHAASRNPWFSWIPFRHAKGEVLTVNGPVSPEPVVLNSGKWLLPVAPGRYRAGATYAWEDLNSGPTAAGRAEILAGVGELVTWEPRVERHEAGIRPIVRDTYPVLGLHPSEPRIGIFNGLGSKGVLWAPYFAEQLVHHMEEGRPLDPDADVRRNL